MSEELKTMQAEVARELEMKPCLSYSGFWAREDGTIFRKGKQMKQYKQLDGYYVVQVAVDGITKSTKVHHLVADAFHGQRPEGHNVDHIDSNKTNNAAVNLQYITPSADLKKRRPYKHSAPIEQTHLLPGEEWTAIPDPRFKNCAVSSKGRFNLPSDKYLRGFKKCECLYFHYTVNGKTEVEVAHQLVAKAFVPCDLLPELPHEVIHLNGNKYDNRAENLVWVYRGEIGTIARMLRADENKRRRLKLQQEAEDALFVDVANAL